MSVTDRYLRNNETYLVNGGRGALPGAPSQHVAIVACMDARLDIYRILGLADGEAHVIRNAGGIVSDDALRSLVISQRLLGTKGVILVQHTDCGMMKFKGDDLRAQLKTEIGHEPPYAFGTFEDLERNVRESVARIREHPFLPHTSDVRGFVFDVATGRLHEVN